MYKHTWHKDHTFLSKYACDKERSEYSGNKSLRNWRLLDKMFCIFVALITFLIKLHSVILHGLNLNVTFLMNFVILGAVGAFFYVCLPGRIFPPLTVWSADIFSVT